jgi:hypothetical protein
MSKIKKRLKEIIWFLIRDIMIYKDPFNPFPEQDNKSETDKERR